MRPASFDYEAPTSSGEAAEMLADAASPSVVIAGGQTLVPQMIRREVEPARLVDINRIDELKDVAVASDGTIRIGALVRHAEIERSRDLRASCPLLACACAHVSNPVIRRRGTIGGSLAWRSGRSEVAAALLACDAEFVVSSHASGQRRVAVADALARPAGRVGEDELIVEVLVAPAAGTGDSWGIAEFAARKWDPALGGAVCRIGPEVRLVAFGDLDRPRRLTGVEDLVAEGADSETVRAHAVQEAGALLGDRPSAAGDHLAAVIAAAAARAVDDARLGRTAADGA